MTASALRPTHPLQSRLPLLAALPAGFQVTPDPFRTMIDLQFAPTGPAVQAVATALGVAPPSTPNTWLDTWLDTGAGGRRTTVVWLGPQEWLVVTDVVTESELRAAVSPVGGAATDVSGQRVTLTLAGARVRDVLAKGCAIDLHRDVFRPGACAQTLLGRAGVIILADRDPDRLTVLVRQSFAPYLVDWLVDAADEFRTG